jgi:hypothetical protein
MGYPVPTITLTGTAVKMPKITLRPDGIGCITELIPSAGNNWECVDETIEDEDASYVYTLNINEKEDLYTVPTLLHSGIITSIKVISYAKSDLNSPSLSAIYVLAISDNACSDIYESSNFNLTTDYKRYDYTWFTNPRTGLAWDWNDVDNLQIGNKCSSPSIFNVPTNLIIRPNGNGTYSELEPHPAVANYLNVDEIVSDEDSTVLETVFNTPNVWHKDAYNIPNHTTETGTINSVTVWARCKATGGSSDICKTRVATYIGGTLTVGTAFNLSHSYADYSTTWITRPAGGAWTWADIDNLEIGVELWTNAMGNPCRVTQVWCVVNYNKTYLNPEIRTTQEYVEINTTQTVTCSLPKPIDIEVNQQIDTKGLNFWSGNREVYAQGRNSKRTNLSGLMWDGCTDGTTSCEDLINCVRTLGKYQNPIAITGLRYNDLNVDYNIISFGWKRINKRPNTYSWSLELEFCD